MSVPFRTDTLDYTHLKGREQSGFTVFSHPAGVPLLGNVIGTTDRELLLIQFLDQSTTITVLDRDRDVLRRVTDPIVTEHGADARLVYHPPIRFFEQGDSEILCVYRSSELAIYTFGDTTVKLRHYRLPEGTLVLDKGRFSGQENDDIVLLTTESVRIGTFVGDGIRWVRYPVGDSVYSRWSRYSPGPMEYVNSVGGDCRIVIDADNDGLDDVLVSDTRRLTLLRQTQTHGLETHTMDIPRDLSKRRRYDISEQHSYRQANRIDTHRDYLSTYNILLYPRDGAATQRGSYVKEPAGSGMFRMIPGASQWQLEPVDPYLSRRFVLIGKDVFHDPTSWTDWAPRPKRLLWAHEMVRGATMWCIDISGDGVPDILDSSKRVTTSGLVGKVTFTLGRVFSEPGDSVSDGRDRSIRGDVFFPDSPDGSFSDINWQSFSGSVADFNGDGALDILCMRPDIEPEALVTREPPEWPIPTVYTIWLFDRDEQTFTRTEPFATKQVFHYNRPIVASPVRRLWSFMAHDFGDLNGDGRLDIVFSLTSKRIGVCLNTGDDAALFDPAKMNKLKVPSYDGLVVVDCGQRPVVLCWDDEYNYTILAPAYGGGQ